MEDSEKRKQMLKAMRMEAAAAQNDDGSTSLETSMNTAHLSNPLADVDQQESNEKPRFDYYTDPMSAYSSFKRNKSPKQLYASSPSHQISSPVPQFPPSAPGTLGSDYHPHTNQGGFQPAYYDAHISPSHRGSSPAAWNNNFRPPPVNNHLPPPPQAPYPFPYSQEQRPGNRYGGRGGYYNNTAPPQFHNYGQQNSNWVGGGNTYPGPGRGRGRGWGRTSFGRDGRGRGRPMEQRVERFYSNSMTEDPWENLKPVLWKSCSDDSSSKSWLPKSIASKKPMMSSESSQKPSNNNNNQQSLAAYLATSLDEATRENESSN